MKTNNDMIVENLNKVSGKILQQIERLDGGIPYVPINGRYQDMAKQDISWWTNGFWGGILWQLYGYSADERFRQAAEHLEQQLDEAIIEFNGLHHDVGFMWLHTAVANYRLTGSELSKTRALHVATILAGRYNSEGKFLRCWNEDKIGGVIVDSLMNIPILYWASEVTSDPRFARIAENHALTVLKNMIRADGSCCHVAMFNAASGEFVEEIQGQSYNLGTSWTRGQSWGIYGMALSYKYTRNPIFLSTAKNIAHYFMANIVEYDYIPPVDFRAPKSDERTDTSAGLATACGLLEVAKYVSEDEKSLYYDYAKKILNTTIDRFANWSEEEDGIIGGGTVAVHRPWEGQSNIIYSDYFLVETLLKCIDRDIDIW